jgi:hypothetical protein
LVNIWFFKSADGFLSQKLKDIALRISLLSIGLIVIGQACWLLLSRHYTQTDDVLVAKFDVQKFGLSKNIGFVGIPLKNPEAVNASDLRVDFVKFG